jgi:hypothetical protein
MANIAGGRPDTIAVKMASNIALPIMAGLKAISPKKPYRLSCKPPPKKRNKAKPIPITAPRRQRIADSANTKSKIVESKYPMVLKTANSEVLSLMA